MRIFFIIIFKIVFIFASAQITNTRKWRFTERDSLDNALLLYEEANYKIALPMLQQIYQNHPKEEFIKYLYGICCLYQSSMHPEALTALSEVYANNNNIDQIEFDLSRAYHYNYKFDEALEMVNKHLAYRRIKPEEKAKGELLKQYIFNAKYFNSNLTKAKVTVLGTEINTNGDETMPAISADGSVMTFNYMGIKSKGGKLNIHLQPDVNGVYTSDIYLSQKQNNKFTQLVTLDNMNSNANDISVALSQDAQILFTYKDITDGHGDIYISYLKDYGYSLPAKLKGKVNSYSWEGYCSLAPDGKTLYFSSERSGGFGGKDLYKATLLADSTWGKIVNLGDSINTPYDEDAPFIHADGTTLFYSSKCLKSSGGYDVFKASMDLKDSVFRQVHNLGYPINTPDDDIYFVVTADGKTAYYSAERKGGQGLLDIYAIETAFEPGKNSVFIVKGDIKKSNEIIDTEIKVENISNSNIAIKKIRSNKGKYILSLPAGAEYKITYASAKATEQSITLSTIGASGYTEKIQNVDFDTPVINTVTTATVVIAKVTPTTAVLSPTVTAIKPPTTTIAVTNTTAVVKNTPTVTTAPTVSVVKTTPTVNTTPGVTATKTVSTASTTAAVKSPSLTGINTNTAAATVIVVSPTVPSSGTGITRPANMTMENFVPLTAAQEKVRVFSEKYPNDSADSLDFRVQIAAFKNPKAYSFPHLKDCGKLENLLLEDGITRLTIGGSFKTLKAAYEHNKKVAIAGQNDAFVTVIYKRRRIPLEDLENLGLFKKK